ncbi:hypothetical protein F4X88_05575 [Candidatus Poribacteria bacterium]|nr:hypothetical protein [Candidatus Poribacteria bacterium]MXV82356.1 hypothetical protein [Candidatus Poribacteria bacterium]MYA55745.1 hypothetical protein [Candidatus Poribacteria bacterium]
MNRSKTICVPLGDQSGQLTLSHHPTQNTIFASMEVVAPANKSRKLAKQKRIVRESTVVLESSLCASFCTGNAVGNPRHRLFH